MTSTLIELTQVGRTYATARGAKTVLQDVNLAISAGETTVLRGVNGSGKTTLLRIVAGLDSPSCGGVTRKSDRVGWVPQDYSASLIPWFTVVKNVELPLLRSSLTPRQRLAEVRRVLQLVGAAGVSEDSYPSQLSGGQRQRVSIARALTIRPEVLVLDEPFANLDPVGVRQIGSLLMELGRRGVSVLLSAHGLDESLILASRIVFLLPERAPSTKVCSVSLPSPRNWDLLLSEEFFRVRSQFASEAI